MIFAALLLLIIVMVGILVSRRVSGQMPRPASIPKFGSASTRPKSADATVPSAGVDVPGYVEALLSRWSGAGLMTEEQAVKIRAFERSLVPGSGSPHERTRVQAIAEALGYLGGLLGLTGAVVLTARFWDDFGDAVRLGIPAATTLAFVLAGFFAKQERGATWLRLRSFLWTLAVVAVGLTAWVFVDVAFDVDDLRRHWMAVGLATGVLSGLLWWGRERPLQQITLISGGTITLGTFIGEFASAGFSGIGIWISGVVLVGVSVRATGMQSTIDVFAGSAIAVVGAFLTTSDWRGPGLIFVLVTGVATIVPAVMDRVKFPPPKPLVMGVVGLVALVQGVPMAIAHYLNEAGIATGSAVWVCGLVTAVIAMQRRVRLGLAFLLVSGLLPIVGAAVTGVQSVGFATLFGLATSGALIAFGTRPGSSVLSVFGLIGIVVFIPWMISHFFPGEGRVPLLIIVSGLLLVGVAVALTRLGGRLRGEVGARSSREGAGV